MRRREASHQTDAPSVGPWGCRSGALEMEGPRRMAGISTFDSTKTDLVDLLGNAKSGEAQLPDFQRGWVWDDDHIRDLIASVSRAFPIGTVMLLETGGEVAFKTRGIEGAAVDGTDPELL